MAEANSLKKIPPIVIFLALLSFGMTCEVYSMTQVKSWINQIRPGTFETADATGDIEVTGPKVYSEAETKVLTALKQREEELRTKEALHEQRAQELKSLSQQIEQKLDQMRRLQAEIELKQTTRKELDEKDISRMVRYYETMDPERTAVFFNQMDRITAMHLIMRMNPRKASAVLELVDPPVAVDITEKVTQFKQGRLEAANKQ
jgi:flagellar motility protein MotE (MotC chaperone)